MLVVNTPIKGQEQTRDILITLIDIVLELLACAVRSKKENSEISKLFIFLSSLKGMLTDFREGKEEREGEVG